MPADIPRLAWPLRVDPLTGSFAVVEQDSDEDIAQCLKAIALTTPGERPDVPDMGVEDLTFGEQPLDLDQIRDTFNRHEPRVTVLASTNPDALDEALAQVGIEWARVPQTTTPDEEG